VQIAFDGKPEFAADSGELEQAHVAEFRLAHAEIAETEGETAIGVELREKPGALRVGGEKLDDGVEVDVTSALSMRMICAWQLARSCSVCGAVPGEMATEARRFARNSVR